MKRILFDINVILAVLLDRQPHVEASATAWAAIEAGILEGMLAAHAVTTIHYLIRKEKGGVKATRVVSASLRGTRKGFADLPYAAIRRSL